MTSIKLNAELEKVTVVEGSSLGKSSKSGKSINSSEKPFDQPGKCLEPKVTSYLKPEASSTAMPPISPLAVEHGKPPPKPKRKAKPKSLPGDCYKYPSARISRAIKYIDKVADEWQRRQQHEDALLVRKKLGISNPKAWIALNEEAKTLSIKGRAAALQTKQKRKPIAGKAPKGAKAGTSTKKIKEAGDKSGASSDADDDDDSDANMRKGEGDANDDK